MKSSDSVFNKMSYKQWKRLEKEQGWTVDKKAAKELDKLIAQQEAEEALRQQTEMFWLLQLQFMARSSQSLADIFNGIRYGALFVRNKHAIKMEKLLGIDPFLWTEEQHNCLATHLALQLAQVEE